MWVINIDGSCRKWLRPEKTYTVGRSSKDVSEIVLKEPSVSRKHLKIEVGPVQPMSTNLAAIKSSITITDLGSRFGSLLDQEKLDANTPKKLSSGCEKAILTIGTRCKVRVEWIPLTITLSAMPQQFDSITSLLQPMEIKVVSDIVPSTTHFMKTDKTSTKLVFALSKGLPIVSPDYAQALANAADAIESDFSALPNPLDYLADPRFAPNADRKSCLASQTFYIMDKGQFEALEPVIKQSGGKCVLNSLAPYEKGMLVVDPPEPESRVAAQKLGSVVEPSAFLTSIRDCTPVKLSRRRPQKQVDMLAFMTQPSTQPTQPAPLVSPEPVASLKPPRKKPKQINMLEFMTQSQPSQAVQPEKPTHEKPTHEKPAHEKPAHEKPSPPKPSPPKPKQVNMLEFMTQSQAFPPPDSPSNSELADPELSQEVPAEDAPKRRRAAPIPAAKRQARTVDVDVQNYDTSESESIPDTPEATCVVPVLNCIAVPLSPVLPDLTPSQWSDMPNFKAFKRKQQPCTVPIPLAVAENIESDSKMSDESLFVDETPDPESSAVFEEEDEFSFRFS